MTIINKLIALGSMVMLSSMYFAQTEVEYFYDAAGNRVQRVVVTMSITYDPGITERTSIIKENGFEFSVYPNITEGDLTISAEQEFMELANKELYVFDMSGKLLEQKPFFNLTETLDMSSYLAGSYIVKAISEGTPIAEWKVIKQ